MGDDGPLTTGEPQAPAATAEPQALAATAETGNTKPAQDTSRLKKRLSLIFHPKPELARLDTGLRYTDILFGFVIREIFLRLQYWQHLDRFAWLYLSTCLSLVLGSWIGYRRSLNRSSYEVKFFNLPFFRFLLDQGMLILYFQTVNSRAADLSKPWTEASASALLGADPSNLARDTVGLLVLIFLLYWLWDILGMRMAVTECESGRPRYPEVQNNVRNGEMCLTNGRIIDKTEIIDETKKQTPDRIALTITTIAFVLLLILWLLLKIHASWLTPIPTFVFILIVLLGYRMLKEIRTSLGARTFKEFSTAWRQN